MAEVYVRFRRGEPTQRRFVTVTADYDADGLVGVEAHDAIEVQIDGATVSHPDQSTVDAVYALLREWCPGGGPSADEAAHEHARYLADAGLLAVRELAPATEDDEVDALARIMDPEAYHPDVQPGAATEPRTLGGQWDRDERQRVARAHAERVLAAWWRPA